MTKIEDLKALLTCPFCSGNAEFDEGESKINDKPVWHVGCANEECVAYCLTDSWQTKEAAALAWNTRPTVAPTYCACGDTFTADAKCINCITAENAARENKATDGDAEIETALWAQEAIDNMPDHMNDAHAAGCWAYTYQELIFDLLKAALQSIRKPPEILSVDDAEKFLFQNSMLSMHGAHETINKFIKRFPHGIRIEE